MSSAVQTIRCDKSPRSLLSASEFQKITASSGNSSAWRKSGPQFQPIMSSAIMCVLPSPFANSTDVISGRFPVCSWKVYISLKARYWQTFGRMKKDGNSFLNTSIEAWSFWSSSLGRESSCNTLFRVMFYPDTEF